VRGRITSFPVTKLYRSPLKQETRSVELGVCPTQLFHFWSRGVHPVQNLLLCTQFHRNRIWFFAEIWRYNDFQNGGRPPSWILEIFVFNHVTFIQFKICCRVPNFMKIRWFFTAIWRYIDFKNGGRPPPWNCFTTIQDHPRSLCCWPQLPVKFHANLIHRSEDIAIWIFRIFDLKCLFRPPKWGFCRTMDP